MNSLTYSDFLDIPIGILHKWAMYIKDARNKNQQEIQSAQSKSKASHQGGREL